jgi:dephospho-CoA kinase
VFLIGLTGGIASGKSTVSRLLASFGAETIDADEVARDVVIQGSDGLDAIVAEFGAGVLTSDGVLDRQELGRVVFADPNKRKILEAILHPLIRARTYQLISESSGEIVVYAVPLLVEAKVDYPFDMIVTVEASPEIQVERMMKSRGLSRQEASSRLASQASKAERVKLADVTIDSSGTHTQLEEQVRRLWPRIIQAAKDKLN